MRGSLKSRIDPRNDRRLCGRQQIADRENGRHRRSPDEIPMRVGPMPAIAFAVGACVGLLEFGALRREGAHALRAA